MSDFRKLEVYKKSLDFVQTIHRITRSYPAEERFALTDQLKRAAYSICANIAEGTGRFHHKDFIQFIRIALGSLLECESLLDISFKVGYIQEDEYKKTIAHCAEIGKMLNGLIRSISKN